MSDVAANLLLEATHEASITSETLRALVAEERSERAEMRQMITDALAKVSKGRTVDGVGGTVSITVTARDENARIKTIEIRG